MMSKLPVLLVGYLRLSEIQKSIERLVRFGVQDIYLAIDGAKTQVDLDKQRVLLEVLQEKYKSTEVNLRFWHRSENLGVAASVITAIDWFFSQNSSGIILEDDILFDEKFIQFCERAWDIYGADESTWMVSGSNFKPPGNNLSVDFINYPMIWGWCSSAKKWKRMREAYFTKPKFRLIDWVTPNLAYFLNGRIKANLRIIDTWDIQIAYEMLRARAYSVLPPVNLICNKGFDDKAIHTTEAKFPLDLPINDLDLSKTIYPLSPYTGVDNLNHYYEREIFRIGYRHLWSLLKLRIWILLFSKHKRDSLEAKLAGIELPND